MVVIDEAYASFANKDTSYIKPLLEKFPNLLIVRTLSKFYGLPGLRLGFAFMGTALTRFLNYSTKYLGYNRLSEELGIAVLKSASCRSNGRRPANVHERTEYPRGLQSIPVECEFHSGEVSDRTESNSSGCL